MHSFYPVPVSTLIRPESKPEPAPHRGAPPAGFYPVNTVPVYNAVRYGGVLRNSCSPGVLAAVNLFR